MKSEIMKKAWEIKKSTNCTMSEALTQAWAMLRIVAITEEIVGKTKITRIYINGIMESYRWTYVGKSETQNEKIVKTYKSVA